MILTQSVEAALMSLFVSITLFSLVLHCDLSSQARPSQRSQQVCCRCIDKAATCNNEIANVGESGKELSPGLACESSIECKLFDNCDPEGSSCTVNNVSIVEKSEGRACSPGKKTCCNPGPGGGFEVRLGLVSAGNPLGVLKVDTQKVCEHPKLSAVQDFGKGVTCGKRDSR